MDSTQTQSDDRSLPLTRYDTMRQAIIEAHSIDDVKEIRDKAEALRRYFKQVGESRNSQNMIAEIKLRAERRGGELSKELPTEPGKRTDLTSDQTGQRLKTEVLKDAGISRGTVERWESIAAVPEPVFEAHIAETKSRKDGELTSASMLKVAQELQQEEKKDEKREVAQNLPDKVYNVIYADPPWQYSNTGVHGAANHHYETMSIEQLEMLPQTINLQIAKDAVLFLWITNPLMAEAFHLIERWGFSYKTNMVWVKTELQKPGSGFYVRGRHELLFICTRGSFTPLEDVAPPIGSVVDSPVQEHSQKPEQFYQIIERLYPQCSYVELFARNKRKGWDVYGNQTDKY